MIPLNFLAGGKLCDFTLTGTWAKKAYTDAQKLDNVNVIFDGIDNGCNSLTDGASLKVNPDAAYLHITSSETFNGTQWRDWPAAIITDVESAIITEN